MKKTLLAVLVLGLAGCEEVKQAKPNQKERQRIFLECLKAIPAGPQSTKYNDWDEVVTACENAAYYQSLELR